ncbi:MAG: hypothetical protein ACWA5T_03755 [Parvularcula sp.]
MYPSDQDRGRVPRGNAARRSLWGLFWRILIYGGFGFGVAAAAAQIFYVQWYEVALIFIAAAILAWVMNIAWVLVGVGLRSLLFGASGVLTRFVLVFAAIIVGYLGATFVFDLVDRSCRSDEWPHWYCL